MGDPKYPRKVWRKPKRPLNYDLKMEELRTVGTYGLRTKKELWKAHTELSRVRHQARSLLALRREVREEREPILMRSLAKIGLVSGDATLDDVLNLQVTDLLGRRLQTIVWKKLGFRSPVPGPAGSSPRPHNDGRQGGGHTILYGHRQRGGDHPPEPGIQDSARAPGRT